MDVKRISADNIEKIFELLEKSEFSCIVPLYKQIQFIRTEYRIEHLYELTEDQFEDIMQNYEDDFKKIYNQW